MLLLGQFGWLLFLPLISLLTAGLIVWLTTLVKPTRRNREKLSNGKSGA